MRNFFVIVLSTFLVTGCVSHNPGEPSPARSLGNALGYLVFSPVLIIAGLLEGIATAPYLVETDLHDMNREMEKANSNVTLDETYQFAYGRQLDTVPKSGDTGKVFRHMSEATGHFQNVLKGYGVADYDQYLLTAVRSADKAGYTLYSVVYRPERQIRVLDQNERVRTVSPGDRSYYRPYERDANDRPLDVVIDWAGVPRTTIKTQKGQAILMTLAANSVLINRRYDTYWDIEKRWIDGNYESIVTERKAQLDRRMGQPS
jgi:uncharacterized protein YcfL